MSIRIQLIIGAVLILAVVFFVLEWCESGPVRTDTPSFPDAGSPGVISVSPSPDPPVVETEPEPTTGEGTYPDVWEMGQADQGDESATSSPAVGPAETERGVPTTDELSESESSAVTSNNDEEMDPPEPDKAPAQALPENPEEAEFELEVRSVFEGFRYDMMECYDLLLELEPLLSADLVFDLVVRSHPTDPERSEVELVSVSSAELVLDNVACFAEAAAELDFPPPMGGGEYSIRHRAIMRADPEEE